MALDADQQERVSALQQSKSILIGGQVFSTSTVPRDRLNDVYDMAAYIITGQRVTVVPGLVLGQPMPAFRDPGAD